MATTDINLPGIEFVLIRKQLILFGFAVLTMMILTLWAMRTLDQVKNSETRVTQQISKFSEKLQKRLKGNTIYETLQHKYRRLFPESNLKPDKLRWMEQLQEKAESLKLPSLTYNIKAKRQGLSGGAVMDGDFSVFVTEIELQAGLAHDGELLQLIQLLKEASLGQFSVEECSMSANRGDEQPKPGQVNIIAQCTLEWYQIERQQFDDLAAGMGEVP